MVMGRKQKACPLRDWAAAASGSANWPATAAKGTTDTLKALLGTTYRIMRFRLKEGDLQRKLYSLIVTHIVCCKGARKQLNLLGSFCRKSGGHSSATRLAYEECLSVCLFTGAGLALKSGHVRAAAGNVAPAVGSCPGCCR